MLPAEILRGFPGIPGLFDRVCNAEDGEVVHGARDGDGQGVVDDEVRVASAALGGDVLLAGVALAVVQLGAFRAGPVEVDGSDVADVGCLG